MELTRRRASLPSASFLPARVFEVFCPIGHLPHPAINKFVARTSEESVQTFSQAHADAHLARKVLPELAYCHCRAFSTFGHVGMQGLE